MKEPLFIESQCSLDFGLRQMHRSPGLLPISMLEFHFYLTHCNFVSALCLQRKEWTWDESKMVVMHDPVYRYAAGDLDQLGPVSPERCVSILPLAELPPPRLAFQRAM